MRVNTQPTAIRGSQPKNSGIALWVTAEMTTVATASTKRPAVASTFLEPLIAPAW